MSSKAKGISIRQKLVNWSRECGVSYQYLETTFILERLVVRLILDENLHKHLVFKGGFVALKVYDSVRYTVDVDALIVKANVDETLERAKTCLETDLNDGVWFRFENQLDLVTQGEYGGIRQTYRAGIGDILKDLKKAQVVHFDVGIGDVVTPCPLQVRFASSIIPVDNVDWAVYPIETIIAEKMHAIFIHGNLNSRSKDVYDLSTLLPIASAEILLQALKRCFKYRKTELPKNFNEYLKSMDTKALERGWTSAIASVPGQPRFRDTFDTLLRLIEKLGL